MRRDSEFISLAAHPTRESRRLHRRWHRNLNGSTGRRTNLHGTRGVRGHRNRAAKCPNMWPATTCLCRWRS